MQLTSRSNWNGSIKLDNSLDDPLFLFAQISNLPISLNYFSFSLTISETVSSFIVKRIFVSLSLILSSAHGRRIRLFSKNFPCFRSSGVKLHLFACFHRIYLHNINNSKDKGCNRTTV